MADSRKGQASAITGCHTAELFAEAPTLEPKWPRTFFGFFCEWSRTLHGAITRTSVEYPPLEQK